MNPEDQFNTLRERVSQIDTTTSRARIERNLREAWEQHRAPRSRFAWTRFLVAPLSIGALSFATMLMTSTSQLNYEPQAILTTDSSQTTSYSLVDPTVGGSDVAEKSVITNNLFDGGTYTENGEQKSVLSSRASLSITTKSDLLSGIQSLRSYAEAHNGVISSISAYTSYGSFEAILPLSELQGFEAQLKSLDTTHSFKTLTYYVENISAQVSRLDDSLKTLRSKLDSTNTQLNSTALSASERTQLEEQKTSLQNNIDEASTERADIVATGETIDLSVTINAFQSFWSGYYYQYDHSTLWGTIQYESCKAVHTLITSASGIITFFIWCVVYSVILIPLYYAGRKVVRKIKVGKR